MLIYPAGFYNPAGAPGAPTPASDWLLNTGSGSTIVDSKGVVNFDITGAPTWGAGFAELDQNDVTALMHFIAAATTYYNLSNFSIAIWLDFEALPSTTMGDEDDSILVLGDGTASVYPSETWSSKTAFWLFFDNPTQDFVVRVQDSSNNSTRLAIANNGIAAKYLLGVSYTRAGGAANNTLELRARNSGSWTTASSTSAYLMRQDSSYKWRSKLKTDAVGGRGCHAKFYRIQFYNTVLTGTEWDNLYTAGSE